MGYVARQSWTAESANWFLWTNGRSSDTAWRTGFIQGTHKPRNAPLPNFTLDKINYCRYYIFTSHNDSLVKCCLFSPPELFSSAHVWLLLKHADEVKCGLWGWEWVLPSVAAGDKHAYTVLLSFDNYELCLSSFIKILFYSIHFVINFLKTF